MKLDASAVSVAFDGAPALRNVTFAVASGQLVVVAGPNGSGKTTLLRVLLGLIRPDTGAVRLDGRDLAAYPRRELAETIGALPQREEPAFPLTVRETLLMGRWSRLGPFASVSPEDERVIADALRRCDVAGLESRRIDSLSGGEWQRVRVARALATVPRLLLLDEPTAALDMGHEMQLFELLRQLVADGIGVLAITHDLNLAGRYADHLVLLHGGEVAAAGRPADVITDDIVSRVFDWPVAVHQWPDIGPVVAPMARRDTPHSRSSETIP